MWSGASAGKVQLNRGSKPSDELPLHMIAVTESRGIGPGQAYINKQLARDKDKTAALRLLRR